MGKNSVLDSQADVALSSADARRLSKLLERKSELAAIRATVRRGGLMVVEGGAGVGKTAVLDAACAIAAQKGRLVLLARGVSNATSPLESSANSSSAYCSDAPADERAALFGGSARAPSALLLPAGSGRPDREMSFAVLHGLYWFT